MHEDEVGAQMVGASVTKTIQLFNAFRVTDSKITLVFQNQEFKDFVEKVIMLVVGRNGNGFGGNNNGNGGGGGGGYNDLGKSLSDFNLPTPNNIVANQDIGNLGLLHELQYSKEERRRFVEEKDLLLNCEQKDVYDFACDSLERTTCALIFIDRTGETFLINNQ
ncbi:Hypothetical predicted protein [Octopus vulgaris]|uniref:Uncharacterized protein n=1 Tax=Octopus vulgaris TaxID=6645 RepID=A0AA36AT73_OCTVU|nr:Hypothetical predicted protein [Octopus vulgaris]